MNIILHSAICLLTLLVYNIFLGPEGWSTSFYAAALFAVHPIHTEAVITSILLLLIMCTYIWTHYNCVCTFQVSGIVGRAELLCSLFMWLSILLYNHTIYAKNALHACVAMFCFAICITAAMLCKETGITAIVSIIYKTWIFFFNETVKDTFLCLLGHLRNIRYSYCKQNISDWCN